LADAGNAFLTVFEDGLKSLPDHGRRAGC